MTKIEALAKYLELEIENIDENTSDEFKVGRETYLVLTNDEADDLAAQRILDSLWAFNPSFLAAHTDLDQSDIELIQSNGKCEDNNNIFRKLINDLEHFINDAIMSDSRAHFLNTYDDAEEEAGEYFVYRIN
jgi:hypothetical protein